MHLLLPSDVFPPGSVGGAAWSVYTLAHALVQQGHGVTVVVPVTTLPPQPTYSRGVGENEESEVRVVYYPYKAPHVPFVRNYYRHERLWQPLANFLIHQVRQLDRSNLVIHAQHVQTTPAAVLAGAHLGIPVIATVRDHWPWDYFATGLHGNCISYPQGIITRHTSCTPWNVQWSSLTTDLIARMGAVRGLLALPALPYIVAHMRRRGTFLAQTDAVIAVSTYMAQRLAPPVSLERLHVIPNMVDCGLVERIAATPPETPIEEPFLLFVGKLERNKGAGLLVPIFRALRASPYLPRSLPAAREHRDSAERKGSLPLLMIAGTGELRAELEQDLTRMGIRVQFLDWVSHDEILRLLARCMVLLFPSIWGEPLSRVLLEASAVGATILAMPTGGTPDIITHEVNGIFARTPDQFAQRLLELLNDTSLRRRLGAQARQVAHNRFAVEVVRPQLEAVYETLQTIARTEKSSP